ncbi:MAG: RrF2 family transcriptional regulator [Nitrospirae bacterium]|nr:MAG: RrF2 family transcriptional regulator [Nitrospirota bacterium]
MYLSARGEYGIMAVLDLALAKGSSPVQAKGIADRQGIPLKFLEHILRALRHAGLIESSRGIHGGYRLAKPADQIRLGDVVQAVEGPIAITPPRSSLRAHNGNGHGAPHSSLIQDVWEEVKVSVVNTLNRTTLADLCRRVQDLEEQRTLMYHI